MTDRTPMDALEEAIASVRLAGLTVSQEGLLILRRAASGEISYAYAKKLILESVSRDKAAVNDDAQ